MLFLSFNILFHIIMDRVNYIQQMMLQLWLNHHLHRLLFYLIQNSNFLAKNLNGIKVFFWVFDYYKDSKYFEYFKLFKIMGSFKKFEDLVNMNFHQTQNYYSLDTQHFHPLYSN